MSKVAVANINNLVVTVLFDEADDNNNWIDTVMQRCGKHGNQQICWHRIP